MIAGVLVEIENNEGITLDCQTWLAYLFILAGSKEIGHGLLGLRHVSFSVDGFFYI